MWLRDEPVASLVVGISPVPLTHHSVLTAISTFNSKVQKGQLKAVVPPKKRERNTGEKQQATHLCSWWRKRVWFPSFRWWQCSKNKQKQKKNNFYKTESYQNVLTFPYILVILQYFALAHIKHKPQATYSPISKKHVFITDLLKLTTINHPQLNMVVSASFVSVFVKLN